MHSVVCRSIRVPCGLRRILGVLVRALRSALHLLHTRLGPIIDLVYLAVIGSRFVFQLIGVIH
jgi:hypothetical protein